MIKILPNLFFFTNRHNFIDIFATISSLPKNSAIIIREYDLSKQKKLEFAKKIKEIAKKNSLLFLIGKDKKLAQEMGANGVHFSDLDYFSNNLHSMIFRKNNHKKFLYTFSAHKISAVKRAAKLGFKIVFYSPIFKTKSHLNQKGLGISQLRRAASLASKLGISLYALGGINQKNSRYLRSCKISGIGGISWIKDKYNKNILDL